MICFPSAPVGLHHCIHLWRPTLLWANWQERKEVSRMWVPSSDSPGRKEFPGHGTELKNSCLCPKYSTGLWVIKLKKMSKGENFPVHWTYKHTPYTVNWDRSPLHHLRASHFSTAEGLRITNNIYEALLQRSSQPCLGVLCTQVKTISFLLLFCILK